MGKNKENKRPFFKQIWFWVVVVIAIAGVGGIVSSGNNLSEQQDFKTGDIIKLKDQEIIIASVDKNYSPKNEYIKASDGKMFVKVNIQIKNISNDKISYNVLYWKIEDSTGDIYSYTIMAQADDSLNSGDLAAGGTKNGSIVFEVPADDTKLKVHYQPSIWSDDEIIINL